jgi:simple sugar transport system substrate-binding protein/ribose transport system substrate-binding protein
MLISDDGVPFEMCDIGNGSVTASQSQPANLYAKYALTYALDAANGVTLHAGQAGGGAPKLQNVSYHGDTNLADPIVAPFVTKTSGKLTLSHPVDGLPGSTQTTSVHDSSLWGNVYGAAHGGVCSAS